MCKRLSAVGVLIAIAVLIVSGVAAVPAAADHSEDGEDGHARGNSDREITVEAECHEVEVTSSRDISKVTIFFTDGTKEKVEVGEPEYSESFEETVDHAIARSGPAEAEDEAEDCVPPRDPSQDDGEQGDDDESDDEGSDDDPADADDEGSDDEDGADSDDDTDGTASAAGTDGGSGGSEETRRTTTSGTTATGGGGGTDVSTSGSSATTASDPAAAPLPAVAGGDFGFSGGSAHVLAGIAFAEGAKVCPAGRYKGKLVHNLRDCERAVLGTRFLANTGAGDLLAIAAVGLGLMGLGGITLRQTRRT